MVSQFLIVIGNIIANYRQLGQDAFIRETILMAMCSFLQNRPYCPTLKSAVLSHFIIGDFVSFSKSAILSHFRNRRFCLIFEIGGFVSFKIGCFVLPPGYCGIGYYTTLGIISHWVFWYWVIWHWLLWLSGIMTCNWNHTWSEIKWGEKIRV